MDWLELAFGIVVGGGLFTVGRKVYGRPGRMFAHWHDMNPIHLRVSKGLGIVLIFAGTWCAATLAIAAYGRAIWWLELMPIPAAALAVIFLRPNLVPRHRSMSAR